MQIIYVKAPSNQQIHQAAVDGTARVAYLGGANYGQAAAEVSVTPKVIVY